jgi:hypothetical protein
LTWVSRHHIISTGFGRHVAKGLKMRTSKMVIARRSELENSLQHAGAGDHIAEGVEVCIADLVPEVPSYSELGMELS